MKKKKKNSLGPKQVQPVNRPILGIDHDAPASDQLCVGPSGEVGVSPARYHVKLE